MTLTDRATADLLWEALASLGCTTGSATWNPAACCSASRMANAPASR